MATKKLTRRVAKRITTTAKDVASSTIAANNAYLLEYFNKHGWPTSGKRRKLSEAEIAGIRQFAADINLKNRSKNPAPTQEEIEAFIAQVDEVTLFAEPAYGRRPSMKDWEGGKDFRAYEPRWKGGTYFSIRDAQLIYDSGYRKIIIGGTEGFDIDLVVR